MRLVLLTGEAVQHDYVSARLSEAFGEELAGIVVARPAPDSLGKRMVRYRRRYSMRQIVSRLNAKAYRHLKGLDDIRRRTLQRLLGGRHAAGALYRRLPSHNGPDCLSLLDEAQPDVIAVYGTGIIRDPVCQRARVATVNMHTGLSPMYRGSDTIFWPLHNEEPECIGVTIHRLTQGIDAGPILATGRPGIEADDDEDSLFAKSVIVGTELLIDSIRATVAGTSVEMSQEGAGGHEYRFVDRTVKAERKVARLLRSGLLLRHIARS